MPLSSIFKVIGNLSPIKENIVKITKRQLRKIIREAVEEMEEFLPDYQQADWKLGRILGEDQEAFEYLLELLAHAETVRHRKEDFDTAKENIVSFLQDSGKGEELVRWADHDDASWEGFADYMLANPKN